MENNKYQEGKIYKIVCNITNEIYIGSTILELKERLRLHKTGKDCVCRNIINRGDYKIELIKDYPCNNRRELEEEETKYINKLNCINKNNLYQNKEKREEYLKQYREVKKEELNKKAKEKITCECGAIVARGGIAEHKKTLKHKKLTECIILD